MAQSGKMGMADAQKTELWHRWHKGEPIHEISRAIGERRTAIYTVLYQHGGFTPQEHKRSSRALSLAEREEVSRGLSAGHSIRAIARSLQRSPSTISREIDRNGGRHRYRAMQADTHAWERARRLVAGTAIWLVKVHLS